ncbi:hypothetical protein BGZ82_010119, partial [Podila clonocystis]
NNIVDDLKDHIKTKNSLGFDYIASGKFTLWESKSIMISAINLMSLATNVDNFLFSRQVKTSNRCRLRDLDLA